MITINNFKSEMFKKAKKRGGVWENFGQKELGKLRDKIIDISDYSNEMNKKREQIKELDFWASNYNLGDFIN